MKYPLAVINRLMDTYGADILVGYDIACAFARTVANSTLARRVNEMRLSGIVPAFHGHGHNRGCQVHWLPLYFDGAGKEDFEGCERLFSASNHLASGTRLASPFHRRQAIEDFLQNWDEQKTAESGEYTLHWHGCTVHVDNRICRQFHIQQLPAGPFHHWGEHRGSPHLMHKAQSH